MTGKFEGKLASYLRSSDEWSTDRERAWRLALRTAWICAGILGLVALAEAIAIMTMLPLKTVEPYTLLVDRQTGYVQALKPMDREALAPDKALTRSMLAQYVIARESFDIDSLKEDYRKVTLWSSGEARERYIALMQASNPVSPLARLPRRAVLSTEIRAISSLGPQTILVRFATRRIDQGGQEQAPQLWQAVVTYRFAAGAMSAADRLTNPLGFQVLRYRRDAEIAPVDDPAPLPSDRPRAGGEVLPPVPAVATTVAVPAASPLRRPR